MTAPPRKEQKQRKPFPRQDYNYFLVLDFEATCEKSTKIYPQEIIEIPVLKIHAKTFETEAIFHTYVQPTANPILTPFCTELTGITQDVVCGKPKIEEALKMLDKWMLDQGLLDGETAFVFVTCGDWDLKTMLPGQCKYFRLPIANYFKSWINIKRPFSEVVRPNIRVDLMEMLQMLDLEHHGRHHSGIDDTKNIANILQELAKRGCKFKATSGLTY
ncbi:ERI1 exoribonuclease 3-like [Saccoglossus kowalevskii]|uniref:ERI1 exoribonuclease 3-like n=1 Tax=Saccoglossus kowalevskii TaxID=10224 RepID=A0ABM0GSK6_SACKO|nr:PREDICTED: ERI1 exoribonuclease 3-like [Saccoglossus kowalevskii]